MLSALDTLAMKATSDPAFRAQAMADPHAALESIGLPVPADVTLHVYENGPSMMHVVLPARGELAVQQLPPAVTRLFERAWADPAFKTELLRNPKETIAAATSLTIPAALKLVAHANSESEMSLVLPYVPASSELSDADLEAIAGGKGVSAKDSCNIATGVSGAITVGGLIAAGGTFGTSALVSALSAIAGGISGLVSAAK